MKKVIICLVLCLLSLTYAEARDYAKLQIKEMKHAQKYGTTKILLQNNKQEYSYNNIATVGNIKDPKIMKFGNYTKISPADYKKKAAADEKLYEEQKQDLIKKYSKRYKTMSEPEDYYQIYRVAERLIRANNLDYMNWRISLYKDTETPNAYTNSVNYVAISTSLLDNFSNNDDALAMVIGHEMGHALLGHNKRSTQLAAKMQRQYDIAKEGSLTSALIYAGMKKKYLADSKNMEYAADIEGAKLALHAGYSLDKASDVLTFLSTYDVDRQFRSTHPFGENRLENLKDNMKYFPQEWKDMGEYNLYNTKVMPMKLSSDKKSIVILAPEEKLKNEAYYSPESIPEVYARFGYMYYINGEFSKSLKNFDELFQIDQTNAPAYLYASYASEYLYKNTGDKKYLNLAKNYAQKAYNLDPKNKYIKEQVDAL